MLLCADAEAVSADLASGVLACPSCHAARLREELGVPAATVRGWLRRLRARAAPMRKDAMATFGLLTAGRDAPYSEPSGSALGDALSAVIACALAAITWHGYADTDMDALLGQFGLAAALTPAPAT